MLREDPGACLYADHLNYGDHRVAVTSESQGCASVRVTAQVDLGQRLGRVNSRAWGQGHGVSDLEPDWETVEAGIRVS